MKRIYAVYACEGNTKGMFGNCMYDVFECEEDEVEAEAAEMSYEVMECCGDIDALLEQNKWTWEDNETEIYQAMEELCSYDILELQRDLLPVDEDGEIDFENLIQECYNIGLQEMFYKYGIKEVD